MSREISDGLERGAARIEHENEQEYDKKTGSPTSTTINHRLGEGVENKTYGQKNRNNSTQKDPKTAMACNNATKNEHVLDKKHVKSRKECLFSPLTFARCLLLLLSCGELM